MKDYLKTYIDRQRNPEHIGGKEVSKGTKEASDTFEPCQRVGYPEIEDHLKRLHYALEGNSIIGEPTIELCLVGCGKPVSFYYREGTGYGYCPKCDVHQRIETRIV